MHTWTWEIATGKVSWSEGIEALIGLDPGTFGGTFEAFDRLLHPDDRDRVLTSLRRALDDPRAQYDVEHRLLLPDGSTPSFACRGIVVRDAAGAPTVVHGVVWDVSARKASEARLLQLYRVSAVVTAINKEIIRGTNERELFERACRIAVELGGFRFAWVGLLDEASGDVRPVARCGHEDGYLDEIGVNVRCERRGQGPSGIAVRTGTYAIADDMQDHPGLACWRDAVARRGYRSSASFPLRREGRVIGVLNIYSMQRAAFPAEDQALLDGLAGDMSFALEAMVREERRRVAEDRHRMVLEHATDGIFLCDAGMNFVEVNSAGCKMVGYSREEMLSMRVSDLYDPDELAARPFQLDTTTVGATILLERRWRRKDGSRIDVELHAKVLPGGMQQAFVRDIRERRELSARLLLADRLASLGQLAAGIAHEINNPLAYVALNLELARRTLREAGEVAPLLTRSLADSEDGVARVRAIVRELDAFGRGDEQRLSAVDVNRALDAAIRIADSKIRHRVELVKAYGSPPLANANELRLGQVFINLLVNAVDAIAEAGPPPRPLPSHEIRVRTGVLPDGRAFAEVSDTGVGMTSEVKGRIFDTFFTTKPIGAGTGLGLSICHRIVTSLGGEITVDSEPGRGSTFRVALPAYQERGARREAIGGGEDGYRSVHRTATARARRGGARVLVVDDEKALARVIKDSLTQHDVTIAEDGRQARALALSGTFDCIVCDLLMPDLSGADLYGLLLQDGRGLERRIVFMTGGAFAPTARAFLSSVPNRCIEKPFSLGAIDAAVAEVVAEGRASSAAGPEAPSPREGAESLGGLGDVAPHRHARPAQ
jgi:PAS domain S-box-containing protein